MMKKETTLNYDSYVTRDISAICDMLSHVICTPEQINFAVQLLKSNYSQGLLELFATAVYRKAATMDSLSAPCELSQKLLNKFPQLLKSLEDFEKLKDFEKNRSKNYPTNSAENFCTNTSFNTISVFLRLSVEFFDEYSKIPEIPS